MSRQRHEIQVGAALLVSVLVLIVGLLWLQQYSFRSQHHVVQVTFEGVGGLGPGDPVLVRGIPMGRVKSVELGGRGVMVRMDLAREVPLTEEAVFLVASQNVMGDRMVTVEPGRGQPVADVTNHVFPGSYQVAITEMMGRFEELNDDLLSFLQRVDSLVSQLQEGDRIPRMMDETTRAARTAADLLERNAANLGQASRSMAKVGESLEQFLDKHGDAMGRGVDAMATTAGELDTLVTQLSTVAAGAENILEALQQQKGAMGRMIFDEQMGDDVTSSVKQLKALLEDLKRNPERYLTVKIF